MPGGSTVGNRVLSFFPRGPLATTREVSRYSNDLTPATNAFSFGVEQKLFADFEPLRHLRASPQPRPPDAPHREPVPGRARATPASARPRTAGRASTRSRTRATSNYDGVAVALAKRYTHRYSFLVSYTYSRNKDNLLTGGVGSTFSNNNDPDADFGPSNQSVPHVFTASGLVGLPWGFKARRALRLAQRARLQSRAASRTSTATASSTSATPPRRATASAPRPTARSTRAWRRSIKIGGRNSLSALIEGFNLLNRDNVKNISNVAGAEFGTPTDYFPGRELQLGVRWMFGR